MMCKVVFLVAVAVSSAVAHPFGNCGPWDTAGLGNLLSNSGSSNPSALSFPGSSQVVDSPNLSASAFPSNLVSQNIQFPPLPAHITQHQTPAPRAVQSQTVQFPTAQSQTIRLPNVSSGLQSPILSSSSLFETRIPNQGTEQRTQAAAQTRIPNFQTRVPSFDGLFPPIPPLSSLQSLQSLPAFPQQIFQTPNVVPCGNF